jgi:hypothetical protein
MLFIEIIKESLKNEEFEKSDILETGYLLKNPD